jgi:hypothetical protein
MGWPFREKTVAFPGALMSERMLEPLWVTPWVTDDGVGWSMGVDHGQAVPEPEIEKRIQAWLDARDELEDPFPYEFATIVARGPTTDAG